MNLALMIITFLWLVAKQHNFKINLDVLSIIKYMVARYFTLYSNIDIIHLFLYHMNC